MEEVIKKGEKEEDEEEEEDEVEKDVEDQPMDDVPYDKTQVVHLQRPVPWSAWAPHSTLWHPTVE